MKTLHVSCFNVLTLALCVCAFNSNSYVITNIDPSIVTNYSLLASNLNNNNNNFVAWLNTHDNTNSYFFTSVSNLNALVATLPTMAHGTFYPSNTWNQAAITNAMTNFSFWVGNSNGQALVSLSLSNGVARVKQLMP